MNVKLGDNPLFLGDEKIEPVSYENAKVNMGFNIDFIIDELVHQFHLIAINDVYKHAFTGKKLDVCEYGATLPIDGFIDDNEELIRKIQLETYGKLRSILGISMDEVKNRFKFNLEIV
ncbi:hypothetical protein P9E34_14190 [Schinkia azotoformans]|uniref:hypothetical protein n=1 Tax=Schinkia azotoformans TaxID=1454 RepID=UPI002DBB148B|nr:hypothetical protein [Schinkia azotoformans]MEC1725864.1 hypothetical protein [Schinkia azotoformans]